MKSIRGNWLDNFAMQVIFIRRHLLIAAAALTIAFGVALYAVWYRCMMALKEERLQYLASGVYQMMENRQHGRFTDNQEDEVPNWLTSTLQKQESKDQNNNTGHSRTTEYCRPLSYIMRGQEGQVNSSLELVSVHVIIRHGDRSPIYGLPGIKAPKMSCLFEKHQLDLRTDTAAKYFEWLKSLKHTPANSYPNNPLCEGGQLTPQGMLQHIANGQYLRKAYRGSLLDQSDGNSSVEIYVRTSENSRNFQSVLSLIYGLVYHESGLNYSIKNIQVSNVTNFCSPRLAKVPCHCPVIDRDHTQKHLSSVHTQIVNNNAKYTKVKARFAQILGVPEAKIPWLGVGLDVLMAYECHHLKLPCVSQTGKCLSHDLVSDMWNVIDKTADAEARTHYKKTFSSLVMHPLLREIAYRLKNQSHGLQSVQFILYSGHDKMLIPLTIALGVYDGKWPGYASRLVIELYKGHRSKFYVRILYNGKDSTAKLKVCKQFEQGLCPLNQFLKSVFSERFSSTNAYRKMCNAKNIVTNNDK